MASLYLDTANLFRLEEFRDKSIDTALQWIAEGKPTLSIGSTHTNWKFCRSPIRDSR